MRPRSPIPAPVASALLVAAAIGACAAPIQPGPPITSCEPLELRDGSGAPIELSGEWSSNDQGRYHLRQVGDCLTWVGVSRFEGQSPGDAWVTTFRGRIGLDRTISGEFLDVAGDPPGSGTLRLRITDRPGSYLGLSLDLFEATGSPYGGSFWERVRPGDDAPVEPGASESPDSSGEPIDSLAPGESPTEGPPQTEGQ